MKFESAFAKFKKGGLVLYRRGWEDCGYFKIVFDPQMREKKIYCYDGPSSVKPISEFCPFTLITNSWFWSDDWKVRDEKEFDAWLNERRKEYRKLRKKK
jgi:hypothetical protein